MSRAMNLKVSPADVTAMCDRHNVAISAIEPLPDGGTRVVLTNAAGAATIANLFKTKVITGTVRRTSFFAG
ncbi:hypothetical protein AWL63_10990 [Sphingomonas panacis]|uniref:Uncharacterized protein n=1 Tax=Sphingomonas panacis TaxID=1560345 RepID=A0A1B3ZAG1_9SPHN|nr:hypothetical protein [Sphingomonas panacis]AOH84413.1 hypothetical protein AWL63_10990 [Sphingomonas panacis]